MTGIAEALRLRRRLRVVFLARVFLAFLRRVLRATFRRDLRRRVDLRALLLAFFLRRFIFSSIYRRDESDFELFP